MKKIISFTIMIAFILFVLIINCSEDAVKSGDDDGGGTPPPTSTTIPKVTIEFTADVSIDTTITNGTDSYSYLLSSTINSIEYVYIRSGEGLYNETTNNIATFDATFDRTGGYITSVTGGTTKKGTISVSASDIPVGQRWIHLKAMNSKKNTIAEMELPEDINILSNSTQFTIEAELDSIYGSVGITVKTNN